MRIDPHPEDFLELGGQALAAVRMEARKWPSGKPCRELGIADLQRFVDCRMEECDGPAALAVRQKALAVLAKQKARHRAELRAKWAREDEEAARADLLDTLNALLDYAETGDVARVPVVQTSAVAEKAIAEAVPANYTRTAADDVTEYASERGFTRVVDNSIVGDGTTHITLVKPPQSPFSQADIQACIEVKHREVLTCSPEQRLHHVAEAIDVFECLGGASLLAEGKERAAVLKRIARFRRRGENSLPIPEWRASRMAVEQQGPGAQPSGP